MSVSNRLKSAFVVTVAASAVATACGDDATVITNPPNPTTSTGGSAGGAGGADGAGGASSSSTTGGGGTGPVWGLYRYDAFQDLTMGTWSRVPLATEWADPNAPPDGGDIESVEQFYYFDLLVVVTSSGLAYVQQDGDWQAPRSIASLFPDLDPTATLSSYTVPGSWPQIGGPQEDRTTEQIVFSQTTFDDARFFIYDVQVDLQPVLTLTGVPGDPTGDCDSSCTVCDGPNRPTDGEVWGFKILDPSTIGMAEAFRSFSLYQDDAFYQFGATFCWEGTPAAQSPLFAGKAGAPDPLEVKAAWYDDASQQVVMVAPLP